MRHRFTTRRLGRRWLTAAIGVLAGAGLTVGLLLATGSVAGADGGTNTTPVDAPNGYHACVDPSTLQLKDGAGRPAVWPNNTAHPQFCNGGRLLVEFSSLQQAQAAMDMAQQAQDAADPSQHVLANGPYPGATQLKYGSNSTEKWPGDQGASAHDSWVACPPGGVAIGGGFVSGADAGAAAKNIQVTVSAPTQVTTDGQLLFNGRNGGVTAIPGNPDGAFLPNAWVVEGYNIGTGDLIVRPYVVCSAPSQTPS